MRVVASSIRVGLLLLAPAVLAGAPKLVVSRPEVDVGAVDRGDVVEARFELRNAGDAELIISRVEPG